MIILYILAFLIVSGYLVYVGRIALENFTQSKPTFLKNKDTVFLISQNLYCYDDPLQIFLEDGLNLLGYVLPAEWRKIMVDKVREMNESKTDEYSITAGDNGILKSNKFNNQTNEPDSEIVLELVESEITDEEKNKRPKDGDNFYLLDGDVVTLKINGKFIPNDANVNNSVSTVTSNDKKSWWVIKIDRFYSENKFDNKIVNNGCILLEKYDPLSSGVSKRLSTNCDVATQSVNITGIVSSWLVANNCVVDNLMQFDNPKCSVDNLIREIESVGRTRTIEISSCGVCYHWQIRQKNK